MLFGFVFEIQYLLYYLYIMTKLKGKITPFFYFVFSNNQLFLAVKKKYF
jgi:hypothetical protein